MKINPFGPIHNNPYKKIEQQQLQRDVVKKSDKVEISNEAKEMLSAEVKVSKERQEKIDALREQVQSGNYKVDSKAVAQKFYEFWTE
ncbi:flagellar biosynthesis anti-sigma factor FlgM [Anaerobacillus sp. MEB173]|uniref:flagellar biosynthesis anti-sigma factor FlgM n=1 Tax=Anaerobacillus sp. MEB173 TaxID=3383345 RepID=UPI003F904892